MQELAAGATLLDVHGHVGFNDPDGFTFSGEQLIATLTAAEARGVVMPMHEPDGYPDANDRILGEAAAADGRLYAFCRIDPKQDAVAEAQRCIDAGARGIKLHPRAEGFEMSDPEIEPLLAFAHERRLPVLIHAGRGIPTLARDAVALAGRFPEARIILAHAAICDLSWIWRSRRITRTSSSTPPGGTRTTSLPSSPSSRRASSSSEATSRTSRRSCRRRWRCGSGSRRASRTSSWPGSSAARPTGCSRVKSRSTSGGSGPERFAYSLLLERLTSVS